MWTIPTEERPPLAAHSIFLKTGPPKGFLLSPPSRGLEALAKFQGLALGDPFFDWSL